MADGWLVTDDDARRVKGFVEGATPDKFLPLPPGEMSQAEIDAIQAPIFLEAPIDRDLTGDPVAVVRAKRDACLAASDWTELAGAALSDEARVAWQAYRQALRDVPQQGRLPAAIEWPSAPA